MCADSIDCSVCDPVLAVVTIKTCIIYCCAINDHLCLCAIKRLGQEKKAEVKLEVDSGLSLWEVRNFKFQFIDFT